MQKLKRQRGYIETLDRDYNFTYDNNLLQLVPKNKEEIKSYDFLKNKNMNLEILEGKNERNQKIFFLNCSLHVDGSGYIAKPAGYICVENDNDTFNTITFKGGIMDYFYRCNQILDEKNSNWNEETGEATIKLLPFSKTTRKEKVVIGSQEATLVVSVTSPATPVYMKENYNLGKPETILRLEFKQNVSINEFKKVYMYIYNLMAFLNFRRDISMGEVSLGKINEGQKVEQIAYTYLVDTKLEVEMNPDNIIGYYFVENNISELLKIVNEPQLNLLFIPKDKKSAKYITPENYMICCTSFESVFNYIFPNARTEYNQIANEVKKDLLTYIEQEENKYKGNDAKRRGEYKKYKDMINFLDFNLPEKFEHCQVEYASVIAYYNQIIRNRLGLSDEEINIKKVATAFGKKRNMLMHSSLESFEKIHVAAYLMARIFIYVMIMKKAGVSDRKVINAINEILI